MTNVGDRPTVETEGVIVETFIIDFDEEIYGTEIRVDFLNYIREELKFDSLEELKCQIAKDVSHIGDYRD
jgi:riboflavin kinase/FMN adenylyltransferase